jgi:type IV pilus assembly protein PilE
MSAMVASKIDRGPAMSRGRRKVPDGRHRAGRGRAPRGFTLIELIVAVTVVGILTALALPVYSTYIQRSKRSVAKTVILQGAQFMERNYTQAGCYNFITQANCVALAGTAVTLPATLTQAPTTGVADYTITLASTTQGFTLTASPCGAKSAACSGYTDPTCGDLTLDNTGTKGASLAGSPAAVTQCWQR